MSELFIYQTHFQNGRENFLDVIVSNDAEEAESEATEIVRGISDEYALDHQAFVTILGATASTPGTVADMIQIKSRGVN